jgi:hypothetical protein
MTYQDRLAWRISFACKFPAATCYLIVVMVWNGWRSRTRSRYCWFEPRANDLNTSDKSWQLLTAWRWLHFCPSLVGKRLPLKCWPRNSVNSHPGRIFLDIEILQLVLEVNSENYYMEWSVAIVRGLCCTSKHRTQWGASFSFFAAMKGAIHRFVVQFLLELFSVICLWSNDHT